jgi:hypothetical protein
MKIGVSLIALLAVGLLAAASSASARPSASVHGFGIAVASPRAVAHDRPAFTGRQRMIVAHRRLAPPIPPRRRFFAPHRIAVERLILFTTPAFTTPVLVAVRPVCCG